MRALSGERWKYVQKEVVRLDRILAAILREQGVSFGEIRVEDTSYAFVVARELPTGISVPEHAVPYEEVPDSASLFEDFVPLCDWARSFVSCETAPKYTPLFVEHIGWKETKVAGNHSFSVTSTMEVLKEEKAHFSHESKGHALRRRESDRLTLYEVGLTFRGSALEHTFPVLREYRRGFHLSFHGGHTNLPHGFQDYAAGSNARVLEAIPGLIKGYELLCSPGERRRVSRLL
jgi:hypothetical protein